MVEKEKVLLITSSRGQLFIGATKEGFNVVNPYVERNFMERVIREICFRVRGLPKKIWYNKTILNLNPEKVIIWDTLTTVDYLMWVHEVFSEAQLNFLYGNMIGKAKHILPSDIPSCYRIWTYDGYDSKKYGIRKFKTESYMVSFVKPKEETIYDVLYVGKDKGRGDYLLQLEDKMKQMGLRTKFIITADGRLSKTKSYYQKPIPYEELVSLIVKSKAILNIALENQQGITVRDMESMFFDVKLLTTNEHIKETEFYNPDNVYIIKGNALEGLPEFLERPLIPVDDKIKSKHTFERFIEEITSEISLNGK